MHTHPLEPLIEDYLAEKDITKGTFELYNTVLKQYTNYLKAHKIQYANTRDVINYRNDKRSQGYSSRWLYHQISAIRGLYKYLSQNQKRLNLPKMYANDITASLKNERIEKTLSKPVLSVLEAKQLIVYTKENRKYIWHYRDHAILFLMLTTGIRSIEVRRARKKDLHTINHQRILYIQGKGRQSADDFVKIAPGVASAICDYLNKRRDKNPYLFISHSHHTDVPYLSRTFFPRMLKRVLKESGLKVKGVTPHSLRHTAATLNLLRGETLEATKQFMRHADLASTLIYAHHTNHQKDDAENQIDALIMNEAFFNI